MNKEKYNNVDIENLLTPRCEFHASPGLKEKVLKEARLVSERPRRRFIPRFITIGMSATAIVAVVLMIAPYLHNTDLNHDKSEIAEVIMSNTDSVNSTEITSIPSESLIAEADTDNSKLTARSKTVSGRENKKGNKKNIPTHKNEVEKVTANDSQPCHKEPASIAQASNDKQSSDILFNDTEPETIKVTKLVAIAETSKSGTNIKHPVTYNMLTSNLQTLSEPMIDGINNYSPDFDEEVEKPALTCSAHRKSLTEEEEEQYLRRIEKMEYLTGKRVEIETAEALVRYVKQLKL